MFVAKFEKLNRANIFILCIKTYSTYIYDKLSNNTSLLFIYIFYYIFYYFIPELKIFVFELRWNFAYINWIFIVHVYKIEVFVIF